MTMIEVQLQAWEGGDKEIAHKAWTSSLKEKCKELKSDADVIRIVNMLADEGHATPFERVNLTWWMRVPIFVDRQIVTHRLASHSGMSGRYRTMPTDYFPMPEDVKKLGGNHVEFDRIYREVCGTANEQYEKSMRIAKSRRDNGHITNEDYKRIREFVRGMLPQANMTERVTTMNLRAWANFILHRYSTHAQTEICQVAQIMLEEVARKCYNLYVALGALERNEWDIRPKYEPPATTRFFADVFTAEQLSAHRKGLIPE